MKGLNTKHFRKSAKYVAIIQSAWLGILFFISVVIGFSEDAKNSAPSREDITEYARSFLSLGKEGLQKLNLDCSGFTRVVYKHFCIDLPPSSADQYKRTTPVDRDEIQPGDLLFFNTNGKGISHVAICLDSNMFIHSPGKGKKICIDSLEQTYWDKRFICGGIVIFENN